MIAAPIADDDTKCVRLMGEGKGKNPCRKKRRYPPCKRPFYKDALDGMRPGYAGTPRLLPLQKNYLVVKVDVISVKGPPPAKVLDNTHRNWMCSCFLRERLEDQSRLKRQDRLCDEQIPLCAEDPPILSSEQCAPAAAHTCPPFTAKRHCKLSNRQQGDRCSEASTGPR